MYTEDWIYGGADGRHPGADPRHRPCVYTYYSPEAQPIYVTSEFVSDDQAINAFSRVAGFGSKFNPKWLAVDRPDGTAEMLPVTYDSATNVVEES